MVLPETRKTRLSTMWIFAVLNYLYADVIGMMKSETLQSFLTGTVGSMQITEGVLLGAAVLMETAIAMVLLSRVLNHRANRWANITVATLHTVAVLASMFVGSDLSAYYLFFGTIEIACTAYIIGYAWKWR